MKTSVTNKTFMHITICLHKYAIQNTISRTTFYVWQKWMKASAWYAHMIQITTFVYLHMRIIYSLLNTRWFFSLSLFIFFRFPHFFHTSVLIRYLAAIVFSFSAKYTRTLFESSELRMFSQNNNFPFTSYSLDADAAQTINSYPIQWKCWL